MSAAYPDNWSDIDKTLYNRSVRVFDTVKKVLSVKIKVHADTQVQQGDIFLFNHFSRFETFIPQFLIYEQSGAYSCAIASGEFFQQDTVMARYLQHVGVFPHDHDRLFSLLTAQILRGRKVIIFPEGSMIKDRQVIDEKGNYGIYSRMTGLRRKQHTGAAVLAQGIEAIKIIIRHAYHQKDHDQLVWWKEQLQLDSLDQLLTSALKRTLIIPANITFYPIRTSENLLLKAVDFFTDSLSLRQTEELLIEGNIMLKNTDMDIRMGRPLEPFDRKFFGSHYLLQQVMAKAKSVDDIFTLQAKPKDWQQRCLGFYFKKAANATRDRYMEEIYLNVTINLSHLASILIMYLIKNGQPQIEQQRFFTILYIAVKHLQNNTNINLHRSLLNPIDYSELISGTSTRFQHFISEAINTGLIAKYKTRYHLLPKLLEDHDFDSIRLENMIAVYDNEAKPITVVRETIIKALAECDDIDQQELAAWHFEDECRDLNWEHHAYNKPTYDDINAQETATADANPFFLDPHEDNGIGVLLIHGLLASPAELRDYGEYLVQQGYTVMGVRLKGHGSSPYALQNQTWEDWYQSVVRGYRILKAHSDRIFVTGFSTGGTLGLKLATEHFPDIIGVNAVAVPIKFINPAFMLVPLLHGTNKLVDWISSFEGIKSFIENAAEHPAVNYRNVPVKSLYELRQLIEQMNDFAPKCTVPVLILQGDNDPVVSFKSAHAIMGKLTCKNKQLKFIPSNRHGILMENIGGTWESIDEFMKECIDETNTK
ncbi:alpha/beta fold hydrolase [Methyloglobulus sp.]|uniref:alpha/beta fold hydrolase n=1 Tax=Methyloglobulus sp. TaxID=2518622 RepID=UPI003988C4EF